MNMSVLDAEKEQSFYYVGFYLRHYLLYIRGDFNCGVSSLLIKQERRQNICHHNRLFFFCPSQYVG